LHINVGEPLVDIAGATELIIITPEPPLPGELQEL
jgi:hypothetical protein